MNKLNPSLDCTCFTPMVTLHFDDKDIEEIKTMIESLPLCNVEPCSINNNQPQNDLVNHPNHYTQGNVECIEALESATINLKGIEAVCTANVIKYMWRWKEKNGTQDLDKAKWYLEKLIGIVKNNNVDTMEKNNGI